MTAKKIITFILSYFFFTMAAKAQGPDYSAQWKKIEGLEKKGLTKDALKEVLAIYNDAVAKGNEPQQIKSAMYQMKYRNKTEEDNILKNIAFTDTLIAKAKGPAKNILLSMQAQLFRSYKENNRYKLYGRTELTEEKSNDISTWSLQKLNERIAFLYKASLDNDAILKRTLLSDYRAALEASINTETLRPTLYDLLAHRALDHFMDTENDVTDASYKFILNDAAAFAAATIFVRHRFVTKDTASLNYNALLIMQDLLAFHAKDAQPDALLDADLKRLEFVNTHGVFSDKEKLYEAALTQIENNYPTDPFAAQAMYLRAQLHAAKGNRYDPLTSKENQFELRTAKQIAESAFAKFPRSEGGINSKNLITQLEKPSLYFQTEKVNVPGQEFRMYVEYKNINKVYLRLVKTSRQEIKSIEQNVQYDKIWPAILALKPMKTWSTDLPSQNDLQSHSVELKVDALTPGTYYLLISRNGDFSLADNIIGRAVTYVSNISYIINNKNEFFALDRDNGQPLANAAVQLWTNKYNYDTRKYEEQKAGSYTTDKNGFVRMPRSKNYENNFIQIKYGGEELYTDDGVNSYYYDSNDNDPKVVTKTFLFTDRSIYRPGQTVFFKGIMTQTDSSGRRSRVLTNKTTTVQLMDENEQVQGSMKLVSNAYGSYNGSFKLPEGLLNGNFRLRDSVTESEQTFNVEEYKRPKFLTEIKKPSGSYRVNDSITVIGTAKGYAGNNIDGAKVAYRVVRIVRYPIWFEYYRSIYPPRGGTTQMEITNGVTTSNAKGEFTIVFKAIPDETVDKKNQPVFDYNVIADVTDINGETRSSNMLVSVSYQALKLDVIAPEKIPADSIATISISSTNINGIFEQARVNFSMYKLQEPNRIFRERYWKQPDMFVMTKDEYYNSFPYDVYAAEDQMKNWALGEKVIDITDTTSENSKFKIHPAEGGTKLSSGWYKIIVTTKDKFGEEVRSEKFIRLTNAGDIKTNDPIVVSPNKKIAEPGDKINYDLATGFDKVWLIQNLTRTGNNYKITYPILTGGQAYTNSIDVTENDRGGINMNYAFIKHNRLYDGSESFAVPWTNKELKISYETFRDKTEPGSNEKWKIKITGSKAEQITAETLLSMYDASLDQFMPHSWESLSGLWPDLSASLSWTGSTFGAVGTSASNTIDSKYLNVPPKIYAELLRIGWTEDDRRYMYRDRMMASPMAANQTELETVAVSKSIPNKERKVAADSMGNLAGDVEKYLVTLPPPPPPPIEASSGAGVVIRKNFNETAFFFPSLTTDANGNVEFSFTMPEALTQWKFMVMAHTKELASAYSTKTTVTQKQLMVQPNAPRFMREGDRMEFSAKIVNLSDKEIIGTSQLELLDAATNQPVDGWFKNVFPNQYFTVPAGQSVSVKFPIDIPFNFNSAMVYRIKAIAKDGSFSDGEEMALPVLTNRMLVTETMPLNMRNTPSKTFKFDKLLNSYNSGSLTNHALTIEYTSNPAWYAIQALPYLMEYPYECVEQTFNRYYANTLASYISNSSPKIKAVFEKWKITDTAALMSNLQKNEELKSVLLQETPWVMNAQNETQQKKNIALLFDMVRLASEKNKVLAKLKDMQSSNGGFSWFKGGADDRYITQYIVTGIGHLGKLNALQPEDRLALKTITDAALPYLDVRLKDEYDNLIRYKADLSKNNLSYSAIQYLYMRSFFPNIAVSSSAKKAVSYYRSQAAKYWLNQTRYMQAMIALALYRDNDTKTAKAIIESLKQNSISSEEMGMYWKEYTKGGYYWYQSPIEAQAMIIEAFTDVDKNVSTINDLKTWLLKQKQTQQWSTTKATAEACYALLLNGSDWLSEEKVVTIQLGNTTIKSTDLKTEEGTGYFKKRIEGDKVQQGMGNITVSVASANDKPLAQSTSWGAAYWQYFEDLDKITPSETPLKLVKKLYVEKNSDKGPVLQPIKDGDELQVGDKIKVRIELRADRDMEYVHMKDMRAACMEPTNVISQYKYQGGLGYYESTKDASTNFFFAWLPKGTFVFEYPMFVTHAGNFSNGITTIQCMYAPEFTSHSEGIRVDVKE